MIPGRLAALALLLGADPAPSPLPRAVTLIACAHRLSPQWFKAVGLDVTGPVRVRSSPGPIPDYGRQERLPSDLVVMVTDRDDSNGILLIGGVSQTRRSATFSNSSWSLHKKGDRWLPSEGNGGIGSMNAVGDFVAKLSQEKAALVERLEPFAGDTCLSVP